VTVTTRQIRIAETFARLRQTGQTAIMPYLTVGFPELDTVQRVVPAMIEGGATMMELGIPFSDPLADGATIQASSHAALENGVTLDYCMETARDLRQAGVDAPLIFMGYFNPILSFGIERFASTCAEVGVDGVIVPDLPPAESDELHAALRRHGRDLIFLVAPTSTDELIGEIVRRSSGFIYCVSLTGVTGARDNLAAGLAEFLGRVRRQTDLPLALGFGISRPEHVREAAPLVDGVIVGSAVISRLGATPRDQQPEEMRSFVRDLRGQ
jgi:tryptophan synthase alpha chain